MQPVGGFGADNLNKRCRLTCVLRFHSLDIFCRYFCNKWTRLDSAVFINISSLAERLADSLGTEHCWVRPGGCRYQLVYTGITWRALSRVT